LKLTIVTICYNDLKGLQKTISSIESLRVDQFEQIVVDGGSSDGTKEFLSDLCTSWPFRFVSGKDNGRYDAMNKGIALATGQYLWFLNSGDTAVPGTMESILTAVEKNSGADLIYGKAWLVNKHGRRPHGRRVGPSDFRIWMPLNHQAIIYKRSVFAERNYDIRFEIVSDWKLTREIFNDPTSRTVFVDKFFVVFKQTGISSTKHFVTLKEQLRAVPSPKDKLLIGIFGGGKYLLIWILKKLRLHGAIKKLQQAKFEGPDLVHGLFRDASNIQSKDGRATKS
jgi:glycosyltransferase involved in cell wall biosynthesis